MPNASGYVKGLMNCSLHCHTAETSQPICSQCAEKLSTTSELRRTSSTSVVVVDEDVELVVLVLVEDEVVEPAPKESKVVERISR